MNLHNRILSMLLAVVLMLGSMTSFMVMGVSAAETQTTADAVHAQYVKQVYKTPEEKLATMTRRLARGDYELYVDAVSGEVAMLNVKTKDILFSNPYDVASARGSDDIDTGTKNELMAQILIKYTAGGTTTTLNSFKDAAMRGQIVVQNVKNGIRVEYTIGQDESRKLVPRQLSKESYETLILGPMKEAVQSEKLSDFDCTKFSKNYSLKTMQGLSEIGQEQLLKQYPICAKMDIYVLKDESAGSVGTMNQMETLIKSYCEDYTFEQMDKDHDETGYVAKDEKYPLFRLALEYDLDDTGLVVSLPCNGLRYDMSSYTLENISVLPYMGAGNHTNEGYNFFPDGSGSLFNYKQLNQNETSYISGKIYGSDYAYHTITGTYERVIRYPVYGSVSTENIYTLTFTTSYELDDNYDLVTENDLPKKAPTPVTVSFDVSNTVMSKAQIREYVAERQGVDLDKGEEPIFELSERTYKRGYVAVIEAGESMAELETYQGGSTHSYNTLRNYFNPKPKDTYTLKDSLSVTGTTAFPVVSDRKYTGDIKIRYQMLTDPTKEIELDETTTTIAASGMKYYETTWLGMAEAYRDNMIENGKLTKLSADKLEQDIPLYLEVFGTLETQQTIATIPVNVMTPLTTFENVYDMYSELSAQGATNINFKLTGFANGGMYATVPTNVKWEKAVGGQSGFRTLLQQAEEINSGEDKNLGLYPDFDFAYIHLDTAFDDTILKDDALKTIDGRYSSKRQYSATQQSYITFYQLAMSPSRYSKFYDKLVKNLTDSDLRSMSVASLGNALNSDFDEEDPYNREDSKNFTIQAFQDLKAEGYSLMTESANAYTWGYVDHILNVDLDSSRYVRSSASVPFIGAVLHGYVQYAGAAFNEEGDTDYAMLRAIENGAGLYFILSYQNTQELKEDEQLSQYYSIRYDIWKNDVASYYNTLNAYLKDVQDKVIIDHRFLEGDRVMDAEELEEALADQLKDAAQQEQDKQSADRTDKTLTLANQWKTIATAPTVMNDLLARANKLNEELAAEYNSIGALVDEVPAIIANINDVLVGKQIFDEDDKPLTLDKLITNLKNKLSSIQTGTVALLKKCQTVESICEEADTLLVDVRAAREYLAGLDLDDPNITLTEQAYATMMSQAAGYADSANALFDDVYATKTVAQKYSTPGASYIVDTALSLNTDIEAVLAAIRANSTEYAKTAVKNGCAQLTTFMATFTEEAILEAAEPVSGNAGGVVEEEDTVFNPNNNKIVLVTYGTRVNGTKTAYKSFILNYNIYAVTVSHNGVVYTIPSGGCVAIQH